MQATESQINSTLHSGVPTPNKRANTTPGENETEAVDFKAKLEECSSDLDYGLIHADLVRENIMLHKHKMQLIDFDDSGFGFRLFELATCLLANANEPNYDVLKTQLIAGYHSVRPLNITHLQSFMLIRSLTYVGWIVPRMHELGGLERCQRFIQRAQDLSEGFLHIECQ